MKEVNPLENQRDNYFLKLASEFSADYELNNELFLKIKATDTDENFDTKIFAIKITDDVSDNPGFDKGNQIDTLNPLVNSDGWSSFWQWYQMVFCKIIILK